MTTMTIPRTTRLPHNWSGWAEHLCAPGHGQIVPDNLRSVYLALHAALGDDPVAQGAILLLAQDDAPPISALAEDDREAHAAAMLLVLDRLGDVPAYHWERSLACRTYDRIGCPLTLTADEMTAMRESLAAQGREG